MTSSEGQDPKTAENSTEPSADYEKNAQPERISTPGGLNNHDTEALDDKTSDGQHRKAEQTYWCHSIALNVCVLAVTTFAALFTGGAFFETYRQAVAAEEQLRDLRNAERPYVFVRPEMPNFAAWRGGTDTFAWPYRFVNYGRTPAIITKIVAQASITDAVPPFGPRERYPQSDFILPPSAPYGEPIIPQPGTAVLPADVAGELYTVHNLRASPRSDDPADPVDIQNRNRRIYLNTGPEGPIRYWLVGQVDYKDIRGGTHHTKFCFVVSSFGSGVVEGGNGDCNGRD